MSVSTSRREGLRVVQMDDGKLNCVAPALCKALLRELDAAAADPDCTAVILTGNSRAFSAGADLKSFDEPALLGDPALHSTIMSAIEDMPVPVVAAMNGVALGGGLELALACHYRIANPKTVLGLPEVTLGVIPGAGGTQRLPRAIGLETALNLMLSGTTFPAERAPVGLLDRLVEGYLLEGAINFAREIATARPLPRLIDRRITHENADGLLQFARGAVRSDPRRLPSLLPLIDAVHAAVKMKPKAGLTHEFNAFRALMVSEESQPFRYAFLAERKVAHVPGIDLKSARPLRTAAVIGAGTMGTGISIALAEAGFHVQILDLNPEALDRGVAHCRSTWERALSKGRLSQAQMDGYIAALKTASDYDAIADADLVIEAVVEQMPVKKAVFQALDGVMKTGAILATNTSTLNVDEIASATQRPQDVLGLHFFSPANIMKLLEIIRGKATASDVLATGLQLAKRLSKVPVVAGVCDGFIGNRMVDQYIRQAMFLLEEGASPQQVDQALEAWGMAMGPFRVFDVVGNDVPWDVRKAKRLAGSTIRFPAIPDAVCERGWFGQKTGKGWYDYKPGARKPSPNRDLEPVLQDVSDSLGLVRRKVSDDEIVQRCIFALVNEAAAILSEGIAQRGSDVDVAYLFGYGFPRFRGGPLHFADSFGLNTMIRQMGHFAKNPHGDPTFWQPHPLLVQLAETGQRLSAYEVSHG